MFKELIEKLKAHPRTIVFTEGTDPRILEASARLLSGTFLTPVLVGNPEEVQKAAEKAAARAEEKARKRNERTAAKQAKDYARADAIRAELAEKGILLKDTREGTTWQKA